jgi:hypothetical protein
MTNRTNVMVALCLAACSSPPGEAGPDAQAGADGTTSSDVFKAIFDGVSKANLETRLNEMTGAVPVTRLARRSRSRIGGRSWRRRTPRLLDSTSPRSAPRSRSRVSDPNLVGET